MPKKVIALCILLLMFVAVGLYSAYSLSAEQAPVEDVGPYIYEDLLTDVVTEQPEEEEAAVSYDMVELLTQNSDFLGYLTIPDTTVSFPVVQGRDNQYYLTHSFDGAYSAYGCPFLDNRNTLESDILVVHGHNMGSNRSEMFSPLVLFQDTAYAESHSTAHFARVNAAEGESSEFQLIAVVNLDINNEFDYFRGNFETEEERIEFLDFLASKSAYKAPYAGEWPEGRILILSTCNRLYGADNRLLLAFVQKNNN